MNIHDLAFRARFWANINRAGGAGSCWLWTDYVAFAGATSKIVVVFCIKVGYNTDVRSISENYSDCRRGFLRIMRDAVMMSEVPSLRMAVFTNMEV